MLFLADDRDITTAPLPVLVAIAALGLFLVRSRSDVLRQIAQATLPGPLGRRFAWGIVRFVGFGTLIVGLAGTVLWFVDNL